MTDVYLLDANQITAQRFVRHYLPSDERRNVWTVEGACVSARRTARYGLPADAECWRYLIEHPEAGWSFAMRVVWRDGGLMCPLATHVVIETYYIDDESKLGGISAAHKGVQEWLRCVPL